MIFTATQAAAAAGREVTLAALVDFQFATDRLRVWSGSGILSYGDHDWHGTGILGSMTAIPFGENDSADQITFTLSGVEPRLLNQVHQGENVRGRPVTVYGLFLDVETSQPLDGAFPVRTLLMDAISYAAKGPAERAISLTAETIWTARNLAAWGTWSDRDQRARHPDDRGCEFIPSLKSKKLPWPVF